MTIQRTLVLALALLLVAAVTAAGVTGAQEAPQAPASTPCAPGAVYDPACDVDHDGDVDVLDIQLAAGHWNQAGTWTGGDYWSLTGNAGTTPGAHFLGTTDNQPLELRVGGQRTLRLEPGQPSPNIIGGYGGNSVTGDVDGATVGGGGQYVWENQVNDDFGTVGGGHGNRAGDGAGSHNDRAYATVGGGWLNTASGKGSAIAGGDHNTANGESSIVAGGDHNTASGESSIVAGGVYNTASGSFGATVGGGSANTASGSVATVPGGRSGVASHYGEQAYASGQFAAGGDAQTSLYVLRQETGDAALTELFLDGSAERITLAADRVMTFDILVVASHRFGGGSSAGYQVAGVIRNIGGVTAFVGTPIKTVLGENVAGWDVQVEADDALDALVVKVQGSNASTIRWVAAVRTVEVGR
jgi:hypothetical protein